MRGRQCIAGSGYATTGANANAASGGDRANRNDAERRELDTVALQFAGHGICQRKMRIHEPDDKPATDIPCRRSINTSVVTRVVCDVPSHV